MKTITSIISLFIAVVYHAAGQYFTIEDIELGIKTYLAPETINNLQWIDHDYLLYSSDTSVYTRNVAGDSISEKLGLNELNRILDNYNEPPLTVIPELEAISATEFSFNAGKHLFIFNIKNKKLSDFSIPDTAGNISLSPDFQSVAYTLGQNIYLQNRDHSIIQITHDSVDGILNGDVVYRNEFGMETGLSWSPQGTYLAYYKKDERKVSKYPMIDVNARVARNAPVRYPMAGMKSEETEVWIYSPASHSAIKLQIAGDPEMYHTNLSWTPDEQHVYLQHLNRGQDSMSLISYSIHTGEPVQLLFTQIDDKYIEPLNPLLFSKIKKGDFFYQSERDGFNHIYYFSATDKKLLQLTTGQWEVISFLGTSESERIIYFTSTKDSPLERSMYSYNRKSKAMQRITILPGTHEILFNKSMTLFIDELSAEQIPRRIAVYNVQGIMLKELLNAPDPVLNFKISRSVTGTIKAADRSTDLYYTLVKPVDFDSTAKYPVMVYVYGGPHDQLITNSWMDRLDYLQQYLAQQGIASFVLDCRGSDSRGRDFEDIIHRQSGIPQLEDQMEGIKYLKSLSFIDTSRIGVHGWSYGGFMTLSMMLNYPGTFKVGVAGGPVTDWKCYEVMYGERYMDRPEENPEGYAKTSVLNKVSNLQGKLLIIHGGIDPVVVPQQSMLFIEECVKNGKQVDYFIYPTHEHNVRGNDRVHLTRMITEYFMKNL
jgi:dipeptidyl-peptidase 4